MSYTRHPFPFILRLIRDDSCGHNITHYMKDNNFLYALYFRQSTTEKYGTLSLKDSYVV